LRSAPATQVGGCARVQPSLVQTEQRATRFQRLDVQDLALSHRVVADVGPKEARFGTRAPGVCSVERHVNLEPFPECTRSRPRAWSVRGGPGLSNPGAARDTRIGAGPGISAADQRHDEVGVANRDQMRVRVFRKRLTRGDAFLKKHPRRRA
jgi:hypothetical protein